MIGLAALLPSHSVRLCARYARMTKAYEKDAEDAEKAAAMYAKMTEDASPACLRDPGRKTSRISRCLLHLPPVRLRGVALSA